MFIRKSRLLLALFMGISISVSLLTGCSGGDKKAETSADSSAMETVAPAPDSTQMEEDSTDNPDDSVASPRPIRNPTKTP